MGQFTLIKRDGTTKNLVSRDPFCTVTSAKQNTSLMGDDVVTLSIVSEELITFVKGDKIQINGYDYMVRTTPTRTIRSENHYEYEVTFYGVIYDLMKTLYRDCDSNGNSKSSTFDLTYSMREFMRVLIYNLERDYPGLWEFDEAHCPDTEPITYSFSRQNCLSALQSLCKEFNLEFQITQGVNKRTIHIGNFGEQVIPPGGETHFQWGKGKGLYTLKEDKVDDKAVITRLWVSGGSTNIRADYRDYANALQLPYPKRLNKNAHTLDDGTVIAAQSEMIGISNDANRYFEDAALANVIGSEEDEENYTEIYPTRTGSVTALGGNILTFVDSAMDFDLNAKDQSGNTLYLVEGTAAKITFMSGLLAGQEFEISKYDHATHTFTIIAFTDERGLTVPTEDTEAFRIQVGDTYKMTDINLPDSYIENAEEELWYKGIQEFNRRKQARAQYTLTFDREYFLDNVPEDSDVCLFHVGDYVPVKDTRFGIEKYIRIQKLQRDLLLDQDYSLTIADTATINIYQQTVLDVINHDVIIGKAGLKDLSRIRRGWRTTEELRNMVFDTDGYFDTDKIKATSIDTAMLTVGAKSQQFVLTGVIIEPNVFGNANRLNVSSGLLSHTALTRADLPTALQNIMTGDIPTWTMGAAEFTCESDGGYYLYARCSKQAFTGTFYLTQQQIKAEPEGENFYYFQVGILSRNYTDDGYRDFQTTYGFTRINGNTITTGKIQTADGQCYLDLDGNRFRIGDSQSSMDWNVTANNQLTLHNVRLLSTSGDTSVLGVYRGTYNNSYTYYYGDEVTYTDSGITATYRYINPVASSGHLPTNSTYWAVVAQGKNGEEGNSSFYAYNESIEKPATPSGDGTTGGWSATSSENVRWMSIKVAKTRSSGTWGAPIKVRGADGTSISIKGTKTSVAQLPTVGNNEGDCYIVAEYLYVWDGTNWQNMGKIKGDPGTSSYLHKKYSNDGGITFTDGMGETPGRWLGLYVDQNPTDSDNPADYTWSDTRGEQGTPGEPGEDGRTTYLHIKYSNDGGLSFTGHNGEDPGAYIGQYTDFELLDSSNPADYTWAKIKGEDGNSGSDGSSGEYYEYRYAKNGSTVEPPTLNPNDPDPTGWTKTQPTLGTLEYMWLTMCKKHSLKDKEVFHIPVTVNDVSSTQLQDADGNYNADKGDGSVIEDTDREGYVLRLSENGDSRIPMNMPFGKNFTLAFWYKMAGSGFTWMLCGKYGTEYREVVENVTANTWVHLAFRFASNTISVFRNGVLENTYSIGEVPVGFSIYDDNMFGSTIYFDEIRCFEGALSPADIASIYTGAVDELVQNWSVPIRVSAVDGRNADPAISVEDVDVEYVQTSSSSVIPTSGWSTDAPTWVDGMYIWSRTKVVYTDGSVTYTDPVCITGGKGGTGNPGNPGRGISSITEYYYLSTSYSELVGGSWSTTRPGWKDGYFIWTKSVIAYDNGTSQETTPICVTGGSGVSQGANLLLDTAFTYGDHTRGWDVAFAASVEDGYRKMKAVTATVGRTPSYLDVISQTLWDGEDSELDGETWYTISFWSKGFSNTGTYLRLFVYPSMVNTNIMGYVDGAQRNFGSDLGVGFAPENDWTFHTVSFVTKSRADWGNYGRIQWRTYNYSECHICMPKLEIGRVATAWQMNEHEKKGDSVDVVDVEYAKNQSNSIAPTTGWSTDTPQWEDGYYIWSRTKIIYSDGGTSYTDPACITGGKGNNGKGITSIVEQYYLSTSNSTCIGGSWSNTYPGWQEGKYLWTRTKITYTDGSYVVSNQICVTGSTGASGKDAATIYVRGTGLNNSADGKLEVYDGKNTTIDVTHGGRGLTLVTINRDTLQQVSKNTYDTYGDQNAIKNLYNALNALNSDVFVCLFSYDAVGWIYTYDSSIAADALPKKLLDFGSSGVDNTSTGRYPFAFLGYKGLNRGYALQIQNSDLANAPYAELSTYVAKRSFTMAKPGEKGDQGFSIAAVFRGDYDANKVYYGTSTRVDIVKYGGVYYIARVDAGEGFTAVPTDTSKWNTFGAQFESVATTLLLAENANVANFLFSGGVLKSQQETSGVANIILNGNTGYASFCGGRVILSNAGNVSMASGNFLIDANGNITCNNGTFNNITLNNVTANSGSFYGKLKADGGLQLPCTTSSQRYDRTPTSSTAVHINTYSGNDECIVYLPSNPLPGQSIFIRFAHDSFATRYVDGNGKNIYVGAPYRRNGQKPISTRIFFEGYSQYLAESTPYGETWVMVRGAGICMPAAQFIYDGVNWHLVSTTFEAEGV